MAGLTDSLRKDFRIMKDLATVTKVKPEVEKELYQILLNKLRLMILYQ